MSSTSLNRLARSAALAALLLGLSAVHSSAATLALWTFETTPPLGAGPHVADSGVFALTSAASVNTGGTTDNPVGNGSAESLSSNGWNSGEAFRFNTSSTGYTDVKLSWSQTRSSTGPATFDLEYSTDGISFTTFTNDYTVLQNGLVPNPSWSSGTPQPVYNFTADLSAVSALDNAPTLVFRLVSQVSTAAGGTNRVDNFLVDGTIVPEPATLALAACGVLGIVFSNRRGRS